MTASFRSKQVSMSKQVGLASGAVQTATSFNFPVDKDKPI